MNDDNGIYHSEEKMIQVLLYEFNFVKKLSILFWIMFEINGSWKFEEEYQNSIGSLDQLKEMQVKNLAKLEDFRKNINQLNSKIGDMEGDIAGAEEYRR